MALPPELRQVNLNAAGIAHKLACLIFRMLRFGTEYVDSGQGHYEQRYQSQSRVVTHLTRRAQQLGYQLIKNGNFPVATSSPA